MATKAGEIELDVRLTGDDISKHCIRFPIQLPKV